MPGKTGFSDEDLKRLKECQHQNEEILVGLFNYYTKQTEKVNISALLARLEAAERVCEASVKVVRPKERIGNAPLEWAIFNALEEWKRSKGEL